MTEAHTSADRDGRVVVPFDHNSAEHGADPFGSYARLRARCPVSYSEAAGGFWVAADYASVTQIARDAETFSAGGGYLTIPPISGPKIPFPPLELDPPDYIPYRKLLGPTFSPREMVALQPAIDYYVNWFFDQVVERGELELIADYASPVPSIMIVDMLGLPIETWRSVAEPMRLANAVAKGTPEFDRVMAQVAELGEQIRLGIADRRERPRDDLLSRIANADIDGSPIDEDLAVGTTTLVISGGVNTMTVLLSNAVLYLDDHRDQHRRLLEDEHFMRTATEEFLRHSTPILQIGRRVREATQVAGQGLCVGDSVLIGWAAANRDPAEFEEPDAVRLDRWPNRHVSFGMGPHRCMGSNLGRAMFQALLRTLLSRAPDFRVTEAIAPEVRPTDNAWESIRLSFSPGPRVLPTEPLSAQVTRSAAAPASG